MLELYRRHIHGNASSPNPLTGSALARFWVKGWLRDKPVKRRALKTRMWGEAEREIERWQWDPENRETEQREAERNGKLILECVGKCLVHRKVENNIAESTEKSYTKTLRHFAEFLKSKNVDQIVASQLNW